MVNDMKILITICGRGGSKGIPGKNTKLLNELPLIAYSIKCAQALAKIHNVDIGLSTDSDEIIKVAADYGLHTKYKRPEYLASDTAGKIDTIKDLVFYEEKERNTKYDYIIDLDITSPLRTIDDLETALESIINSPEACNLFSVSPASRNPYFNMVEIDNQGFAKIVKNSGIILSRQQAPKVYDMNASFLFTGEDFLMRDGKAALPTNLLSIMFLTFVLTLTILKIF